MTNIYMVLVAMSRTRQRRSYRIFAVNGAGIEDWTANICKSARVPWNDKLGTFESCEPDQVEDAPALQQKLNDRYSVTLL
jgi:hypothetical protein